MPRRKGTLHRRQPKRPSRPLVLVYGGERTEPDYFKGLRDSLASRAADDKSRLNFADYSAGVPDAVKRAKQLDPSGDNHQRNPSTGVWRVAEKILEAE